MYSSHTDQGVRAIRGICSGVLLGTLFWLAAAGVVVTAAAATKSVVNVLGGGLIVTPTKIDFTPAQSASRFILKNKGAQTASYKIDFAPLLPHEKHARNVSEQIIWYPKLVTLQPGETQTVRFLLEGDYSGSEERARLRIQTAPPKAAAPTRGGKGPSAGVRVLYGVSVPIVRK